MTDTVKDALHVDQVSKDLAVPGTPKSIISQDIGEGLGEDLTELQLHLIRPGGRVEQKKALKCVIQSHS